MVKQSFEMLLDKYLSGQCTPEEARLVNHWFELVGNDKDQPHTEEEWQAVKDKVWAEINTHTEIKEEPVKPLWARSLIKYTAAASVILALCVGIGWFVTQKNENKFLSEYPTSELIYKENRTTAPMDITLEDGSLIKLDPSSALGYPVHFKTGQRKVVLTGNAFFDIAKNPDKPFLIQAEKTVTQVLGTSFYIKSDAKSNVEVEVKSGKVVFSANENGAAKGKRVELIPNHRATYLPESNHFEVGLASNPQVLKEVNFHFNEASIKDVLDVLRTAYGIRIEVGNDNLLQCNLTGDLSTMDLYTQLDFICQSFNATYHLDGTRIGITGKGCK